MGEQCKCGKGHASDFDNMCKFCREKTFSRAKGKKLGVKYRGDGLTLDQLKHHINRTVGAEFQ